MRLEDGRLAFVRDAAERVEQKLDNVRGGSPCFRAVISSRSSSWRSRRGRANALAPEPPTSTAMETPTTETPTATTATLAKVDVAECHSEPPFPVTRAFSSPPEG